MATKELIAVTESPIPVRRITDPDVVGSTRQITVYCPLCDAEMITFGTADYYLPGRMDLITRILRCPACGVLRREISGSDVRQHCSMASYTDLARERTMREQRQPFFQYLIRLASSRLGHFPRTGLDVGCSYGHLLDLLADGGCRAAGIETCATVRTPCAQRGLNVYGSLEELPRAQRFELITLVDSLYYFPQPRDLLAELREHLDDDGVLLLRISNRNWIASLLHLTGCQNHFGRWLGDAAVCYADSSLRRLLQASGYRVVTVRYREPGKGHLSVATQAFYWTSTLITSISFGTVVLSPGITVLAVKQP